jgi:predicted metal-dependent hydrolase
VKEVLQLGDLEIEVQFKDIKNVHLSVHPPQGRVTLVAPLGTRKEAVRAFAASKLSWIRAKQLQLAAQRRETPRQYVSRESHMLWGKRYLLKVVEVNQQPKVTVGHSAITLTVRPGSTRDKRDAVMRAWHRSLLHESIPRLVAKWENKLGVKVASYAIQQMKTKWGSCNRKNRSIRINSELVKKPKELLEYIVVHEILHLLAPTHSDKFRMLLDKHFPSWQEARAELNKLPIAGEF